MVVCSDDGVDELSSADRTRVIEVADGGTEEWFTTPEELGFPRVELSAIAGGTPEENAAVVRGVLAGEPGPARDVVLMNAGAAILAAGSGAELGSRGRTGRRGDRLGRRRAGAGAPGRAHGRALRVRLTAVGCTTLLRT